MGSRAFFAGSQDVGFRRDLGNSDESEITRMMEAQGFPIADGPFASGEVNFRLGSTEVADTPENPVLCEI